MLKYEFGRIIPNENKLEFNFPMNHEKEQKILIGILSFILGMAVFYFSSAFLFPTYSQQIEGGYFYFKLGNVSTINIGNEQFILFRGEGSSMSPTFPDNALVIVQEINKTNITIGDVITYRSTNRYVTHRIIKIKNGKYLTRGDNVNYGFSDSWIDEKDVVGKVIGVLY